ncbi:hypothetical protein CASFOL_005298 [Castilleja foliolosa]|uniref:Inosine/uridine-preferring nucleoside hydrolase domain-containing protein n=1 Tax=Castilleja foliolosa TaxID=1961234 RepID=A0ABD3E714_9LAMI
MLIPKCICILMMICLIRSSIYCAEGWPHQQPSQSQPQRIILDTDVDMDDVFGLLYLLKLDRSIFHLEAVTINPNSWTDIGHAVNEVYDLLYMMGRDDVDVGAGGEGGILLDGTILSNVGGYLPIIEQIPILPLLCEIAADEGVGVSRHRLSIGISTAGHCRYRQVIPLGAQGKLDADTKFGVKNGFLARGPRRYFPMSQRTTQQVLIDKISAGPITVFITGANTNLAILLMSNPQLKENITRIYIMGGAVKVMGSVYTGYNTNTYAEYNIFMDPFAAYKVIHSGVPVTLIPLDATNTIPISIKFFEEFEKNQKTFEAQYCFKTLKLVHDTWFYDTFSSIFSMWDSFLVGVATSIMLKENNKNGENEFAEMELMKITVVTSNEPYNIPDGSNPFTIAGEIKKSRFGLKINGVHMGHVQKRPTDTFCMNKVCQDGYTKQESGPDGVSVLVAVRAKLSKDKNSPLDKAFYRAFLDVLNRPQQTGKYNSTTKFPYYRNFIGNPDFTGRRPGKNVIFDMDMSAGDFLALFYLLKLPIETINLKAIIVTPTGWANAATIDVIYDLLHMMGRDDIPVGLGDYFALEQTYPNDTSIGACDYSQAIPQGSGGFLDSDTLYGFARDLPRSPRRYTADNSIKYGAPRDTEHPERRQARALEVWNSVTNSLDTGSRVTILTNGPLTNVAEIILSDKNLTSHVEEIIIVGGHISKNKYDTGNVINIPSNKYSEMNMFLDPLAAKTVFDLSCNITLIPLNVQRTVQRLDKVLLCLNPKANTPEASFAYRLLQQLYWLITSHPSIYQHMETFSGELIGAVILGGNSWLNTQYTVRNVRVLATGDESQDGQIIIDGNKGRPVKVIEYVNPKAYCTTFANQLGAKKQSAVIGSFEEQRKKWNEGSHTKMVSKSKP